MPTWTRGQLKAAIKSSRSWDEVALKLHTTKRDFAMYRTASLEGWDTSHLRIPNAFGERPPGDLRQNFWNYSQSHLNRNRECVQCGERSKVIARVGSFALTPADSIWFATREERLALLEECEVLCSDCYTDRLPHGLARYRRGCRCEVCTKEAADKAFSGYRKRNGLPKRHVVRPSDPADSMLVPPPTRDEAHLWDTSFLKSPERVEGWWSEVEPDGDWDSLAQPDY